jgi:alanine-glyoxylate transaminase/serine-glyoxylate transaminase/serine-pyruvate transaminase
VSERRCGGEGQSVDALLGLAEVIAYNKVGTWPYTPAVNLLWAERAIMLREEGPTMSRRHKRLSAAARAAVSVGTETSARIPRRIRGADRVMMPEGMTPTIS